MIRRILGTGVRLMTGRMQRFAMVGAVGTLTNVAIMTALVNQDINYLVAAVIGTEITIVTNFLLQERLVFTDATFRQRPAGLRFLSSFGFNNVETALRMPILWLLVDRIGVSSPFAQFGTLAAAFLLRYLFHARFIYRSRSVAATDSGTPVEAAEAGFISRTNTVSTATEG